MGAVGIFLVLDDVGVVHYEEITLEPPAERNQASLNAFQPGTPAAKRLPSGEKKRADPELPTVPPRGGWSGQDRQKSPAKQEL
jgi:hypothetical protein